jgi:hypothetical protein
LAVIAETKEIVDKVADRLESLHNEGKISMTKKHMRDLYAVYLKIDGIILTPEVKVDYARQQICGLTKSSLASVLNMMQLKDAPDVQMSNRVVNSADAFMMTLAHVGDRGSGHSIPIGSRLMHDHTSADTLSQYNKLELVVNIAGFRPDILVTDMATTNVKGIEPILEVPPTFAGEDRGDVPEVGEDDMLIGWESRFEPDAITYLSYCTSHVVIKNDRNNYAGKIMYLPDPLTGSLVPTSWSTLFGGMLKFERRCLQRGDRSFKRGLSIEEIRSAADSNKEKMNVKKAAAFTGSRLQEYLQHHVLPWCENSQTPEDKELAASIRSLLPYMKLKDKCIDVLNSVNSDVQRRLSSRKRAACAPVRNDEDTDKLLHDLRSFSRFVTKSRRNITAAARTPLGVQLGIDPERNSYSAVTERGIRSSIASVASEVIRKVVKNCTFAVYTKRINNDSIELNFCRCRACNPGQSLTPQRYQIAQVKVMAENIRYLRESVDRSFIPAPNRRKLKNKNGTRRLVRLNRCNVHDDDEDESSSASSDDASGSSEDSGAHSDDDDDDDDDDDGGNGDDGDDANAPAEKRYMIVAVGDVRQARPLKRGRVQLNCSN